MIRSQRIIGRKQKIQWEQTNNKVVICSFRTLHRLVKTPNYQKKKK